MERSGENTAGSHSVLRRVMVKMVEAGLQSKDRSWWAEPTLPAAACAFLFAMAILDALLGLFGGSLTGFCQGSRLAATGGRTIRPTLGSMPVGGG